MNADKVLRDIALISVDMFQTLVNVDSRCHPFWQGVLGADYSRERAITCWSMLKYFLHEEYKELFGDGYHFVRARTVAERALRRMFLKIGLERDPAHAAAMFVKEHGYAEPFCDTGRFLSAAGKLYPVCLVSDADEEMLGPLSNLYAFDYIFTSERAGAYKSSPDGTLFQSVIEHYSLAPRQILHIGDSPFDVLGAGGAGFVTCMLNRFKRQWEHDFQPHFVANSLEEVAALLADHPSPH